MNPQPLTALIRKAITDAYYDARNEGETMEVAADNATRAVLATLDRDRSTPSDGGLREALDRMVDEVRDATRTLSDAYRSDPDEARRWAGAVDRIQLAVAEFANALAATPTPASAPADLRLDARMRRIVELAAHMGSCSQTHHEHLSRDAQKVFAAPDAKDGVS